MNCVIQIQILIGCQCFFMSSLPVTFSQVFLKAWENADLVIHKSSLSKIVTRLELIRSRCNRLLTYILPLACVCVCVCVCGCVCVCMCFCTINVHPYTTIKKQNMWPYSHLKYSHIRTLETLKGLYATFCCNLHVLIHFLSAICEQIVT